MKAKRTGSHWSPTRLCQPLLLLGLLTWWKKKWKQVHMPESWFLLSLVNTRVLCWDFTNNRHDQLISR